MHLFSNVMPEHKIYDSPGVVLDDAEIRGRFLTEFNRYAEEFHVIDNSTDSLRDAVQKAVSFLPWLN